MDTRVPTPIEKADAALDRLEGRLRIDKYDLDGELVEQAHYFNECAQQLADAISYRDEAKSDLEGTRARIDQEVRREAAEEQKKATDTAVASVVIAHPDYQRSQARLAGWSDRVGRLTGLREAIQMRSYALKDLASLYVAGYWAGQSSTSGESRSAREKHVDDIKARAVEQKEQDPERKPRRQRLE